MMKRAHEAISFGHLGQKTRLHVSPDGYVRMPLSELPVLTLIHLISGLDDVPEHNPNDVSQTTISGYTEWLTQGEPAITVGWVWRLDLTDSEPRYVRDGWLCTNLMLVDTVTQHDIGDEATAASLAHLIDQSGWTREAVKHIEMRYS